MIEIMAPAVVLKAVLELDLRGGSLIRELFLVDKSFRAACEDFALASRMLDKFEAVTDGSRDTEIADYRDLKASLIEELRAIVDRSENMSPSGQPP